MKTNKNKKVVTLTFRPLLLVITILLQGVKVNGQLIVYNSGVSTTVQPGLIITIQGGFTNQLQATINGAMDNQGTLNVSGDWANTSGNNVFTTAAGLVTLNGSTAQTVGGTASTNFYDLTLNSTFVTIPQFTLGINTAVRNVLTMTLGKVNLATYTLTLGTAAATPGTLAYTSGWLYGGSFARYMNTPTVTMGNTSGHFPMGSSIDYRPFWAGYSALITGGTISVGHTSFYPAAHNVVSFADASWGNTVIYTSKSYWTVSTTGIVVAGAPFSVRMEATGMGVVATVADLNLTLSGSAVGTFAVSSGIAANPQVNRTGLSLLELNNTATSQNFYFGSKSVSTPLPVELLDFKAVLNQNGAVDLSWITASEKNNDYFTIEKTKNGVGFEKVIRIAGAGNSTTKKHYATTDVHPYQQVSYYRLKQTDFDGSYEYSKLISIVNTGNSLLNIFPNPSNGKLFISLSNAGTDEIHITIYDMLGKLCFFKSVIFQDDNFFTELNLVQVFNPGMYSIRISTKNKVYTHKLIIN